MQTVTPTVSNDDLQILVEMVRQHRELTGESVTSIAERSGVQRQQLSRLLTGTYPHGPQFEMVARLAKAIGKKIAWVDE